MKFLSSPNLTVAAISSYLLFLFVLFSHTSSAAPSDIGLDLRQLESEALLSCDFETNRNRISALLPLVPSRLYHFGEKSILMEDVQAKTVPKAAWDKFIKSPTGSYTEGGFRLSPLEQGLYGTTTLTSNPYHGWLIEIEITESCRDPKRVAYHPSYALKHDLKFREWFQLKSKLYNQSYDQFMKDCHSGGVPQSELCSLVWSAYYDESQIAIIQDLSIPNSFYIRDRSCIKNILGNESDWIKILSEREYLWKPSCGQKNETFLSVLQESMFIQESQEKLDPQTKDRLNKLITKYFSRK